MAKHMSDSNYTPTHEQIARRAYEIFIERGQPDGQDLAHWLEAERQLRASSQQRPAAQAAQAAPATQAKSGTGFQTAATGNRSQSNGRTPSRAAARK